MELKVLHTGPLGVNTLIVPLAQNRVFVVDPASCAFCGDEKLITDYLAQKDLMPVAIVLTHGHFDHVAGLPFLHKAYPDIPIAIHTSDAEMIGAKSGVMQGEALSQMGFFDFIDSVSNLPEPTAFLEEGKTLSECLLKAVASLPAEVNAALSRWIVLHTPGHSSGSSCLYNAEDKLLISGDTLFYGSWGRTDLHGGSEAQIQQSLRRLAKEIPQDVRVYPGHERYAFSFSENF